MLRKLISSSKTLNGVYRAIVIEGEKDMSSTIASTTTSAKTAPEEQNTEENNTETPSSDAATPEQTPTPSITEPLNTKCARVYIPALHRTQMPFKLGADGSIEEAIFESSAVSTVPPEPTTNETAGEVIETDTTVTSDISSIYMKKNDYPIAQICSWSFCPELKMGDQTWVMFENGDAEFPVVIGSLGAVLPDIESIKAAAAANSMLGGTYVGGTTGNPDADYIFMEAVRQGVSIAGGCGILANIEKESNFSVELNNGDGGLASGLCQWHPDRWANCERHCRDNNLDPKTIEGQTSFLISELKGYPDLWDLLCNAPQTEDGAYDCGYQFCFDFERPANKQTKSVERGDLAKTKYFPIFGSGKIENGVYQAPSNYAITINLDGISIKQDLTTVNSSSRNGNSIQYIVIHYTAHNGDTAANNLSYFKSVNRKASAHYFVDENEIGQCVPDNLQSWHCGGDIESSHHPYLNKCTNSNSIGIELCSRKYSNGTFYFLPKVVSNAASLTKALMNKYNVPVDRVIRHYDVTGKICPAPFVNNNAEWQNFLNSLK